MTGIYWAYDGAVGLGTPPRFYNEIVRRVTFQQGNTEGQNARRAAAAASSDESAEETATGAAARAGNAQESWPFGIAEQDQPSNTVQGAWPSGISEK